MYGLSKIFSAQHFIFEIEFFVIPFFYNQVKFLNSFCVFRGYSAASTLG